MANLLSIEWDRHEARYVLATPKGSSLRIRKAAAIALPPIGPGDDVSAGDVPAGNVPREDVPTEDVPVDETARVGETLRFALDSAKAGRCTVLVGVDRASVEMLRFTLPPAEDAELPELVANSVLRELPSIDEASVVDFVALDDDPAGQRRVAAAILSPQRLQQIEAVCSTARVRPDRLILRSHAAASLFVRTTSPLEDVLLLVSPVGDEVELNVLAHGRTVVSRTARLPDAADRAAADQHLLVEIRRTIALAMQGEAGAAAVESVYVCGRADRCQGLLDRIREEFSLPAKSFDPFDVVDARGVDVPEHPERFASLLGMALDEVDGRAHAIDFLHPRKPPKTADWRRMAGLVAIAVALVAITMGYLGWDTLASINSRNATLLSRVRELEALKKRADKQQLTIDAIRTWQAGDVLWLEELRELSMRFPPRGDALIQQMSMNSVRSGGGTVAFMGLVRDSSIVVRMEANLRDDYHIVHSTRVQEGSGGADYARRFDATVRVGRRSKTQYPGYKPPEETDVQP
ncbi:MAG: hypothetical protein V3R99_13950 [Thermoguttaceae bacterium]